MKISLMIATAALLSIGSMQAQAQSMGEKSGVNSMTGMAPSTQDFISEAAMSDMFELQSSQLAESKGDAAAKKFGAKMIADHTKTTAEIKEMISTGKVKATLPTAVSSSQMSMLDRLKGENGADFNKRYKADQVSAHKDAVSLYERYAKGGDNAGLKAFAEKTLPDLREHLKMAQDSEK